MLRREVALEAAAAARREGSEGEGEEEGEREAHVELVLIASPWYDDTRSPSIMNMRGCVGEMVEEKGGQCEVRLWRSNQGLEVDLRTYAPAWRRSRDGKELYTTRKERGFGERVSIPIERGELVADVRGRVVKGGVQLDERSVAWRHLRGQKIDDAQGVVV